jgi:hypothetical protein
MQLFIFEKTKIKYKCTKDFRSVRIGDIVEVHAIDIGFKMQVYITVNGRTHITNELMLQSHFKIEEEKK